MHIIIILLRKSGSHLDIQQFADNPRGFSGEDLSFLQFQNLTSHKGCPRLPQLLVHFVGRYSFLIYIISTYQYAFVFQLAAIGFVYRCNSVFLVDIVSIQL